jgi:dsDNA-binding SOS-regulon protein
MSRIASRRADYRFTCRCGHTFESRVYEYVNVAEDPQLRYALLAGRLNLVTCPACGRRAQASQPFIYSDLPHRLLAYVHPRENAPQEARELILAKLQEAYARVEQGQEEREEREAAGRSHELRSALPASPADAGPDARMPPLQVIFGLDQLILLINASLSQEERLGKIALRTQSRSAAQRGQMLDIARRLAREMQCVVEEEEQNDTYVVWLYGPRKQIGAIMRELAPRG